METKVKFKFQNNIFKALVLISILYLSAGQSQKVKDLLQSGHDILEGFEVEIPKYLPNHQDLEYISKQTLPGLPEQTLFEIINQACSIYLDSGKIDPRITPKAENINFQLRAPCKNISIPILEADKIVDLPEFDVNGQVVIYISGWRTTINGTTETQDMANAFNCRGGYNFLYVDPLNYVQTIYTWSAFNTEAVGAFVAEGIVKLVKKIPLKNIYLIGHSLGAQMVGKAGRQFTNLTGQYIPRITGLDPANPCFNEGEVLSGILRGDADFVDIIHTNPGVLGKKEPRGNVDFYVEGYGPIKPRCTKFGCSHKRAVKYYTESVYPGHESDFLAKRCNSLISLNTGRCDGPEYPMGFATPSNLNGKFFLNVNGVPPYGKNATTGIESNACGLCTK